MKIKISDKIAEQIKESINSKVWPPECRLPSEKQLCKMYGASRVSVRSALQKLSGEGLVETVKGKGTFVCSAAGYTHDDQIKFSITNMSDRINLFEFRMIIEVESAYIAALRANTSVIQALNDSAIKMRDAVTNEDVAKYDAEFHRLIAEATCNPVIIKIFDLLKDAYNQMFYQNVSVLGSFGAEAHRKIITAMEMRNGDLARKYMTEHLNDTMEQTASLRINK
ncbi:MAG: FadR/GntR family transcriptional regulator [Acetivibrionales bacterium]|jgi:GntR family transcriptional repressor for pyruvate dehydrogenase complex